MGFQTKDKAKIGRREQNESRKKLRDCNEIKWGGGGGGWFEGWRGFRKG